MESHLAFASKLANLLDNSFRFGKYRFGLSALIDLIPGIGDFIDTGLSLYIVWIAFEMKVSGLVIVRMLFNIAINFLIGLIPILGDMVYLIRKVNIKNIELLKQNISSPILQGQVIHAR